MAKPRKSAVPERRFVSLAELKRDGISIDVLATAIEVQGVVGTDQFGRVRRERGSEGRGDQAQLALAVLARVRAYEQNPLYRPDPRGDDPPTNPMYHYGWWSDDLPDWNRPDAPNPRARGAATRQVRALENVIAGLADLVLGELGLPAHPSIKDEAALVAHLQKKLAAIHGCSPGSLARLIPRVRRDLHQA